MKKSLKKLTMLVALTLSVTSIFTGCKKSTTAENPSAAANTSKEAKLKMYLLGDKPKDYDLVYGEVNKKLKDKINATLDVQFIPWGDLSTKYPLLFSSGEDFDLIFTATGWAFYNQMATRNGFLELTPTLLEKYAPNSWKNEPKIAWDQAKVNGKMYMIPNDQNEYSANVFGIRGDLREKYGISEIKTQADLEKYYDAVVKNEKDIIPIINGGGQNLQWPLELEGNELSLVKGTSSEPLFVFNMKDTSGKIMSMVDTQQFKDYATKMKTYADKGYWSKNSISSKETRDDVFKAGKAASMVWNLGTVAKDITEMNKSHPEWKAELVDINGGKKKFVNPYTNNGMAVNANSKNAERALMALDLLRYDKEIYDLTFYGVKGTHWDAVGDTQYKTLAATANFPAANVCPWGWTTTLRRTAEDQPKVVNDYTNKWTKEDVVHHPLETFSFDESKVKNEMAAIGNVITQYGLPINLGMLPDVDKAVETYKQKLKEAGIDKVLTEVQKQADDYVKSQK
jgi:putative aldouronate transport system substrate-binding protein